MDPNEYACAESRQEQDSEPKRLAANNLTQGAAKTRREKKETAQVEKLQGLAKRKWTD